MTASLRRFLAAGLVLAFAATPVNAASAPFLPAAPGCPIFPTTNVWNKPVESLRARSDSDALMRSIGLDAYLHPDFSSIAGGNYGIPINVVGSAAKKYRFTFRWPGESDPGPYPLPKTPKIEGGSDRHILVVNKANCYLYELFAARKTASGWTAGSGAIWNMKSNALPAGRLDVRRCGRTADTPRSRALRRGCRGRDPARSPIHGRDHASRVHLSRSPLRER